MANGAQIRTVIGSIACLLSFLTFVLGAASAGYISTHPSDIQRVHTVPNPYGLGNVNEVYTDTIPYPSDTQVSAVLSVVFFFHTIVQALLLRATKSVNHVLLYGSVAMSVIGLILVIAVGAITGESGWIDSYPFLIPVLITFGLLAVVLGVGAAYLAGKQSNASADRDDGLSTADLEEAKVFAQTQQQPQLHSVAYQSPTPALAPAFVPAPTSSMQYMQPVSAPQNTSNQPLVQQYALSQPVLQRPAPPSNILLANAAAFDPGN